MACFPTWRHMDRLHINLHYHRRDNHQVHPCKRRLLVELLFSLPVSDLGFSNQALRCAGFCFR